MNVEEQPHRDHADDHAETTTATPDEEPKSDAPAEDDTMGHVAEHRERLREEIRSGWARALRP